MYYEEYKKRPRRRRRRRRGCLGTLLGFAVRLAVVLAALSALLGAALYWLPAGLFLVEPDYELSLTDGLPSGPFNVLLLGVDVLSASGQRSDTMMIASIDRGCLKLTSIQRDTVAQIDGYGSGKINGAYAHGGAELAMKTVNETFGMNIVRYALVDFSALVKLVDALGGIEVDITQAEMEQINKNVIDSGKVFARLGYTATELTRYGESTHLDGLQALGYARIRKLDSDFGRTSRQRAVINAMLKRLRENLYNPLLVTRFVQAALGCVETNMSWLELVSLGEKALFAGGLEQLRLPLNGTFADNGSTLRMTDRQKNIDALYQFVYE